MSFCLSAWNNSAPTGRIFLMFDSWVSTDNNTVHASCLLVTQVYKHSIVLCNSYCFLPRYYVIPALSFSIFYFFSPIDSKCLRNTLGLVDRRLESLFREVTLIEIIAFFRADLLRYLSSHCFKPFAISFVHTASAWFVYMLFIYK
jgi:hypothetical protein